MDRVVRSRFSELINVSLTSGIISEHQIWLHQVAVGPLLLLAKLASRNKVSRCHSRRERALETRRRDARDGLLRNEAPVYG